MSIAVLDPSEVGAALVAALALDERVVVRHVWPPTSADVTLGDLLAWRTDIVVIDPRASLGSGWPAEQLVAPLLACGTEVVARGTAVGGAGGDRRQEVPADASIDAVVAAVRSLYPELRGRPGPPEASRR